MTFPDVMTAFGQTYIPKVAPPPVATLPPGQYAFIQHDDLAKDDKLRIGMPEVMPLYHVEYTDLTEAWQWFWVAQLVHGYTNYEHWDFNRLSASEKDMMRREWKSLTHGEKAFTNNHGTNALKPDGSNGGIDYINGVQNAGKMAKQGAIYTCGNIVKVKGSPSHKGTPIETLDGTKPPPPVEKVNRLTTPWLIFCATNVAADKSLGYGKWKPIIVMVDGVARHRVDPFPNFGSRDTLVPIRSNANKTVNRYARDGVSLTVNWIKTSRLVPVSDVPRPYVP